MTNLSILPDDLYFNPIPMRRVDYRAKKHGKPMPVRYKRVKAKECAEVVS